MAIQVIVQQAGPLPITASFQAISDDPMYLEINGSVWSQSVNQMIGISISLDGVDVGPAQIYSNGNTTHRAVVPVYIPIELGPGQHTITLSPSDAATTSDSNDFYTAVIH